MAVRITDASVTKGTTETCIAEWEQGDCGYDDDGDLWIRGTAGAVCLVNGEIMVFSCEELDGRMAIKDPNITVEIKVCK